MKTCSRCKISKPLEDFQNRAKNKDGKDNACAECRREYDRDKYKSSAERRAGIRRHEKEKKIANAKWLWEYLLANPCVDCGESDPIVLEFDHQDAGNKIDSVCSLSRNRSLSVVMAEVEKCDVRCANCHRRKTATQFNWYAWRNEQKDM